MNLKTQTLDNINMDNIIYSDIYKTQDISLIYIKYNDKELGNVPFLIETPYFTMSDNLIDITSKYASHEILLPLIGKTELETKLIHNFFKKIDNKLINDGINYKSEWFFNDDKIKYKSLIKYIDNNNDKIYENGVIKFKLVNSKNFITRIYDENNKLVSEKEYDKFFNKKIMLN
jgi:hypothetical protein